MRPQRDEFDLDRAGGFQVVMEVLTPGEDANSIFVNVDLQPTATDICGVTLTSNFVEANDRTGMMVEFLHKGSESIALQSNTVQFNNGYGLETYAVRKAKVSGNTYTTNRDGAEKISGDKSIIMK